ncbi:MAG: sugar ABC transporter permease [Acidobacteria bacterium]|nr:sugar ABC transporter permease [Acidobacteriota bacterium]MBI3424056.1 sugar ABC transporter permease [Acidobacteriota bacterium]
MNARKDNLTAYLFLLPALLLLGVFILYPLLQLLWVSLNEWNILKDQMTWVGFDNYRAILKEEGFRQALFNTFYFVAVTVPVGLALALGLALLLNEKLKGVGLLRTLVFTPFVTSTVAAGVIFIWLMDYDRGLVNAALAALGAMRINFLQSETWAMPAVIVMTIWKQAGYNMILFLAGLQGIPEMYYEAAAIDGAKRGWQTFRHITWPLLWPTTFFVLVISIIFAFRSFEQMFVMTRGGPVGATTTLVYYIFDKAFKFGNMGQAAAVSTLMVGIVLLITWLQFRGQKEAEI